MDKLKSPVVIPAAYNYIGIFLTFRCTLQCDYCLTLWRTVARPRRELTAAEWIRSLNRLQTRADLPVTLQGGEPTAHPGFYEIVNGINPAIPLDLLTNLQFDVDEFMRLIPPERFRREAPYASIRASYHPGRTEPGELLDRVARLHARGYSVGIWGVLHPEHADRVLEVQAAAWARGLDFRVKEFLGLHRGTLHGTYADAAALAGPLGQRVRCRPSELLVAPDGAMHRCHRDLYAGDNAVGRLIDDTVTVSEYYLACDRFGECHPCDIKVKTNRFQQQGHTSVTIVRNGATS